MDLKWFIILNYDNYNNLSIKDFWFDSIKFKYINILVN